MDFSGRAADNLSERPELPRPRGASRFVHCHDIAKMSKDQYLRSVEAPEGAAGGSSGMILMTSNVSPLWLTRRQRCDGCGASASRAGGSDRR